MSEPTKYNFWAKTSELLVGDVIVGIDASSPWSTCIVKQVTEDEVHLFRPYGTTADFTYTAGVICYVGIDQWSIRRDSPQTRWVYQRPTLK